MYTVGKTFTFDAAHRLQHHDGKCKNLHGHTYRVDVTVSSPDLVTEGPARGMVIDFGDIKSWWKPLEANIDHRTLLEDGDPLVVVLTEMTPRTPVVTFDWPPTAENLAIWLQSDLADWLNSLAEGSRTWACHVRVWETPTSWAEV